MCKRHHRTGDEKSRKMVKMVRPANIFIVGITMMIFWFFLVRPALLNNEILPALDHLRFSILMLMTLLVTAGGYVINDILDQETDRINKPEESLEGRHISKKSARTFYLILNILALSLAGFLLLKTGNFNVMALCAGCILILWLYSRYLKSSILMGNVIVSLLIGLVPFIFLIVENDALVKLQGSNVLVYNDVFLISISFTLFAFFANLIREIVKDCEDYEGDRSAGILTIATGLGYKKSDLFSQSLTVILFLLITAWFFIRDLGFLSWEALAYLLLMILPVFFLFYLLTKEPIGRDKYTPISKHLKLLMVFGLIYLLIHLYINYHG